MILVEAERNPRTLAPVDLVSPDAPRRGHAAALSVTSDQTLGDPTNGGVSPGENLADSFLADLDPWSDPIHLVEHAALRIDSAGALAPTPGQYRIAAVVTDSGCGVSEAVELRFEVVPSRAPELTLWIADRDELETPIEHEPGSGNPRFDRTRSLSLVLDARDKPGSSRGWHRHDLSRDLDRCRHRR